jgi:hypothetical protein
MSQLTKPLHVYLPDTRGVQMSRYGKGNLKIGLGVYTYSRLPGRPNRPALGSSGSQAIDRDYPVVPRVNGMSYRGTCPGSTPECESICYARRPVEERGVVAAMWHTNSQTDEVPPIPEDAKTLRLHVSGDFDSVDYIRNWITRLTERPDVLTWVYTRSWRVKALLPALEELRALKNVTVFASMDKSTPSLPPKGWRRAWIDGDVRAGQPQQVKAHLKDPEKHNLKTVDGTPTYVCPEETKRQPNCEACTYCFAEGAVNDVTFLQH